MNRYDFGNKVCELREKNGMTQKELAERLSVSDKAISKWENGKAVPKIETLEEMADIFDADLADLLCTKEQNLGYEVERLRLSVTAESEKKDKIKSFLFIILFSVVGLSVLAAVGLAILFFITKRETFLTQAKMIADNFYIELSILTIIVVIKSFVFGLINKIINTIRTPSNCVRCENLSCSPYEAVHHISALLSVPPIFIASSVSVYDEPKLLLICYAVNIIFIVLNIITEQYSDSSIVLAPQGIFKRNIEKGEFHSYSEMSDFTSNLKYSLIKGKYKVNFSIGKEKYRLSILNTYPASEYLGDNSEKGNIITPSKIKPWQYVTIGISVLVMTFGMIMFLGSSQFGTAQVNYSEKGNEASPLTGSTSIVIYDGKIFAYSEYNCAVNVFDLKGKFLYSLSVPRYQNGESEFYIISGKICILSRTGDLYEYDKNGEFEGRLYTVYDDDKALICLENRDGKVLQTVKENRETFESVYFDNKSIAYSVWDDDNSEYVIVFRSLENGAKTEKAYNSDYAYTNIKGVIYNDYNDIVTANGDDFYILRGTLYKNNDVIYKTPFFEWYRETSFACWVTAAIGMALSAFQVYIYKKPKK